MKHLVLASIALAVLPLAAAETQSAQQQTQSNPQPALTTATTTAANDSPLVKAAKSATANRKKKQTIVITNEMLLKSGGHITTTATQAPLPPVPEHPSEEATLADKHRAEIEAKNAAARAEATKKAQERHDAYVQRVTAEANDATPESVFDEDPAATEHHAQQATDTSGQKKPPM